MDWPYWVPDEPVVNDGYFPANLPADEHGLVAVGGRLHSALLVDAYAKGIFPWYEKDPVLWFSPDPRMVLIPSELKRSKRLMRTYRSGKFDIQLDHDFANVMQGCAFIERPGQDGTWINADMRRAYSQLHAEGVAHCVSVYREGALVGGLYGLALGHCFFGESMFSRERDASKVALVALVDFLLERDCRLIDCQVHTDHLESMGAREVARDFFMSQVSQGMENPWVFDKWVFDA